MHPLRPVRRAVAVAVAAGAALCLVLATAPAGVAPAAAPPAAPTGLTTDHRSSPVDVRTGTAPSLGWRTTSVAQTAYQVQVASSRELLTTTPDVWDSGAVTSASTEAAYGGPALAPADRYLWRVRTWSGDQVSGWSEPAALGTALGEDWGDAQPVWLPEPEAAGWDDYTLTATFRIEQDDATIVFRARGRDDYLMWQFRSGRDELAPHIKRGGTFTQIASVPVGVDLVPGVDYRLRLVVDGDTVTTSLDGREVDRRTVVGFPSGSIGFRTGRSERSSWDDLRVTAAGGEVLYDSEPSSGSSDFSCAGSDAGRLQVGPSQECLYGLDSDWAFLRGEVALDPGKEVAWATAYATATSPAPTRQYVYKMWLNGRFVGLGPTQPNAGETRYDGFDVTGLVRSGQANALGAIAYTPSDQRFLAELVVEYTDGSRQVLGTGPGWRAFQGSLVYPPAGSIGTRYFTAPQEDLQAARFPDGFAVPGFDDSRWQPAQVRAGYDRLLPTPTAKVGQQSHLPAEVVEKAPGHYFLDYGRTWVGGLALDLVGTEGQRLDLRFGEELSAPQTVRYEMRTGNTYQDLWTLREGRQHLETWGMRVFRYAEVIGAPTGLGAQDFPALAQVYPFDREEGVFVSSDPALDTVWALSRDTIEATDHNLYVDSWTRERDAYEADSYLQMKANFAVSDDPTLGEYSIEHLLQGRTWPTEWPMYVVLAMRESYQQTGDVAPLREAYDELVDKLPLEWVEDSTGLVRKDFRSDGCNSQTDCDIVDWPASERDGYVFGPYNTVINAISYRSLSDMAAIATAVGKPQDAERFAATAERLRAAMNARLWDEEKGAYRDGLDADGTPVDHFAVQATVFSTAFGVPDPARAARAADYVGTRGMACSVYCGAFVLETLYAGDRADVAHDLLTGTGLRSWLNMVEHGAGATGEAWDPSLKGNMTWSHPWAASPAYALPEGMFGIRPITPGYTTFDVRPQPDEVEWARVRVPTVKGSIGAGYRTVDGRTDVAVHVPGTTSASVSVPVTEPADGAVYVDGRRTPAVEDGGYLRVEGVGAGCHLLSTSPDASWDDQPLTDVCPDGQVPAKPTGP